MLLPDTNEPGKYRWTSLEGSGLELGDIADVMNPAEVVSLAWGAAAAGKGKILTAAPRPVQEALAGFLGGLRLRPC